MKLTFATQKDIEQLTGHAPGGVCPFACKKLIKFDIII